MFSEEENCEEEVSEDSDNQKRKRWSSMVKNMFGR